jgi:glycogen operon protein
MTMSPRFQGPRIVDGGVRFSLYAPHAEGVELCLFASATGEPEVARHRMSRDGDGLWTTTAAGAAAGQLYGFRVDGPWEPHLGHRFNPAKLLVDPCAGAVTGEPPAGPQFAGAGVDGRRDEADSAASAPKSIVVEPDFDWGDDAAPRRPWAETLIYECHVRGLTVRHPQVPPEHRGTYLGLAAEPVLEHLLSLGVTAVELLPVQQIASEPHLVESGRSNYFGYSPLGFRAPHAGYATGADGRQVAEFKQMVRTLHQHGIEVILDVVFNHTAEGDHRGRTLLFRGIDNRLFYRLKPTDPALYQDFTGCGNTLAVFHPRVAEYVVDTLRYWVETMRVDGFRFDLATTLGRAPDAFDPKAPFFELLRSQPWLDRVKLIAEPWDLGPKGYQLGRFPPPWREWNDRFRDTFRAAWRGDGVPAGRLVEALEGSPGVFGERAAASIDFVTAHDGFTLEDLVSYEHKHNWGNGEDNRDGHDHNLSHNWGVEGPTERADVLALRARAKRNLLASLAATRGVPMLLHGDEIGRTQRGNNNAYCQDNEVAWVDWPAGPEGQELQRFVAHIFALRRALHLGGAEAGTRGGRRRWLDAFARGLGSNAAGAEVCALLVEPTDRTGALVVFNLGLYDRLVRLPPRAAPGVWIRRLSTSEPGERRLTAAVYRSAGKSVAILEFVPDKERPGLLLDSASRRQA